MFLYVFVLITHLTLYVSVLMYCVLMYMHNAFSRFINITGNREIRIQVDQQKINGVM